MDLSNKRALVCGASQGIGEAIALALADVGCSVVAMARSGDKLDNLLKRLNGSGHSRLAVDIGDRDALRTGVVQELEKGPIHILVNNTGGPKAGPIVDAEEAAFLSGFQNHILSASLLLKLLLPGMKADGYGRVINIISTSVKIPIPNLGVSNTIRGAMASWAKTAAAEVGPFGVTVNNVLPGFTATPRLENLITAASKRLDKTEDEVVAMWKATIPARRFAQPHEVAAAAAFLASPAAGYVNGINLPVDGGRTGAL